MAVLICKNISSEGPGTIGDYLDTASIPYTLVDLSQGEPLPDHAQFDTLVMLGGPMSVNEEDKYPYIKDEELLTRTFIAGGKKVFGVCLGAQIMAKALGARVYKGPATEIGWLDIELCDEGLRDPLMHRLAAHPEGGDLWRRFKVFHWHGETFDIPTGALRLASSELYPNQGFRVGETAYAFQFHIEVTKPIIAGWMSGENIDLAGIMADTDANYPVYSKRAHAFYERFFNSDTTLNRR